jgi:peroxiredoxin family protein
MVASTKTAEQKQAQASEQATFICARDTMDGVYPPLLLAINARRLGMEATIFFTFMGLNAILKGRAKKIKFQMPGFMGAIPGMATMATGMMKKKIEKAITADETEEGELFCDECNKEIK